MGQTPARPDGKKLSVVVVSYNKSDYFDILTNSIIAQTRQPDEIIVVDDCSSDGTKKDLLAKCAGWKVVLLPRNRGQSYARNVGLRYVSGKYLIFIDGDIELKPNMLELMERTLDENPEVSIAYGHYDRAGSRTDPMRTREWDPKVLERTNFISMMSMVRRLDLPTPPFDEKLRMYEDWDLWIRMMKDGRKGKLVGDEVMFTAHYKKSDVSGSGESKGWYKIVCEKHGFEIKWE